MTTVPPLLDLSCVTDVSWTLWKGYAVCLTPACSLYLPSLPPFLVPFFFSLFPLFSLPFLLLLSSLSPLLLFSLLSSSFSYPSLSDQEKDLQLSPKRGWDAELENNPLTQRNTLAGEQWDAFPWVIYSLEWLCTFTELLSVAGINQAHQKTKLPEDTATLLIKDPLLQGTPLTLHWHPTLPSLIWSYFLQVHIDGMHSHGE